MTTLSRPLHGLYVITNHQNHSDRQLLDDAGKALHGGARILQYRDKSEDADKRLHQAAQLRDLTLMHECVFIINDDIALAKNVAADGVHLGGEDESIEYARSQLGDKAVIGVSCYNQIDLAVTAEKKGANYAALGRFYQSTTKPGEIYASLDLLEQARNVLTIPIVAIGGISYENAAPLVRAGADMIAVANGVFGEHDIEQAARNLQFLFDKQDS